MISCCDIIKSPVITEKVLRLKEKYNKYVVSVNVSSNKKQISRAIKQVFNVNVIKINVVNVKGKKRRFKGICGVKKDTKKVYFSLPNGCDLGI